ncbi:methyltransferase-like protein 25B [Eriocheir sinensis]|uniref:methyltransferase-like protein 25B n=1 Tax=Eriocheir sinensis TaxID=95602 RepID=UPI0021C9F4A7|nr:methyltransferase-like protein 25B [Eriocheir sinensis]
MAATHSGRFIHLTADNVGAWRDYTRQCVQLLDVNRSILDSYVLDFFTEDLWSRLNPKWRAVLDKFSPCDLASFIENGAHVKQDSPWPLSLLAFRAASHTLSLPRRAVSSADPLLDYLNQQVHTDSSKPAKTENNVKSCYGESTSAPECNFKSHYDGNTMAPCCQSDDNAEGAFNVSPVEQVSASWGDADSELSAAAGQHKLLQHVFRRHLKPKKQHEVARLAIVAGQVARAACSGVMVDVGSGQGHLSRLLAYGHNVRVVSLEAEDKFIEGARKFDDQLEKAVTKMSQRQASLPPLPPGPRHAVCHLQANMDPLAFTKVITEVWPDLKSRGEVCGLLGLHTCGDLAPTLLRIYANMSACRGVVSVGCCYMKLSTSSEEVEGPGYPMSNSVKHLSGHALSYEAREVACHAVEMYTDRLSLGAENLKVHCYRACLEQILVRRWPHHRHAGLRSVNNAHLMDFPSYAKAAITRLPNVSLLEEDLTSEQTLHNLARWQQVVVYYSLRLLLAPVVESVVLLDRLLFLFENGLESVLFPAFDPNLSPRNHVLVSVKPSNKL